MSTRHHLRRPQRIGLVRPQVAPHFARFVVVAALFSALLVTSGPQTAVANHPKPATSWSFYVLSMSLTGSTSPYNLGCNQGNHDEAYTQSSTVALDFGGQMFSGSTEGTKLVPPASYFVNYQQIRSYVQEFARGYYTCMNSSNTSLMLRLSVGTNNSLSRVDYGGGQSWANQVNTIRTWISQPGHNYSSRVLIHGANDMEPAYWNPTDTKNWVAGFDNTTTAFLLDYGSADGCPQYSSSNGACSNGWDQEDLWWVSWGTPAGLALPEIYIYPTNPVQARQWAMISLYGAQYQGGDEILFRGPLDNYYCNSSTNTSEQAWSQLQTEINRNPATAGHMFYSDQMHPSQGTQCP